MRKLWDILPLVFVTFVTILASVAGIALSIYAVLSFGKGF